MQRRKLILAMAAILALLAGGWYYGSPWWTLRQMREAAEARDAAKLARYIDFPALRESSKVQLRTQLAAEAARQGRGGDGLGALGSVVGAAMAGPMVDTLLTPEAMRALFARMPQNPDGGGPPEKPSGANVSEVEPIRESFDRFRLRRKEGDLLFRRHGLGWKLEEIRISAGEPASAAAD